jgi:hypothetical protein
MSSRVLTNHPKVGPRRAQAQAQRREQGVSHSSRRSQKMIDCSARKKKRGQCVVKRPLELQDIREQKLAHEYCFQPLFLCPSVKFDSSSSRYVTISFRSSSGNTSPISIQHASTTKHITVWGHIVLAKRCCCYEKRQCNYAFS